MDRWSAFEILDLRQRTRRTEGLGETNRPVASPGVLCVRQPRRRSCSRERFSASDPAERLRLCREAVALDAASAVAQLALASACRENRDGVAAREALDRAAALAPDWEAVAYESGKLWLVYDDLPRARDAFQRAADLMPTFSAAFSNLGATLGELGEPAAALQRVPPGAGARSAQLHHPQQHRRRLPRAGTARRIGGGVPPRRSRSIRRSCSATTTSATRCSWRAGTPTRSRAYEEGQRRDPQQNRRQGCRLAVVRFANGDAAGAERDLWRCADARAARRARGPAARGLRDRARAADAASGAGAAPAVSRPHRRRNRQIRVSLSAMDPRNAGMPVGRGVGPSVVGHLVRDRSLRLAAGLAIAVAIPVAVLFYFQFRSHRRPRALLGRRPAAAEPGDRGRPDQEHRGRAEGAATSTSLLRIVQQQTEPLNLPFIAEHVRRRGSTPSRSSPASTSGRTRPSSIATSCSPSIATRTQFRHRRAGSRAARPAVPRAGAGEARDQRVRGDDRRPAARTSRRSCGSPFRRAIG